MYAYTHSTTTHVQGNASHPTAHGYGSAPVYLPVPGYAPVPGGLVPATAASSPPFASTASRTPSPSLLNPVPVPQGCYAIELVQFWRGEYKRGQPFPLHWALFLRTAPQSTSRRVSGAQRPQPTTTGTTARGNFYELVGSAETYTAQFLQNVVFEPDALPDWRGTYVIGWVSPGQVAAFEGAARQVSVWRNRYDWRSQNWVYEVARAVGANNQGVFMADGMTIGGLQRHMGRLLDAWESGDI